MYTQTLARRTDGALSLDDAFVNLKVVASLPPHTRLDTTQPLFRHERDVWWASLRRAWYGDGRARSIASLDLLVERCTVTARTNSSLRDHLARAADGINNLRQTYAADATAQASLDRILDKLKLVVSPDHDEKE